MVHYRLLTPLLVAAALGAQAVVAVQLSGPALATAPLAATAATAAKPTTPRSAFDYNPTTPPTPDSMVSKVPSVATPAVENGAVRAFVRVGTTMIMGGEFSQVDGTTRHNLVAFDISTGDLLPVNLDTDLPVYALELGPLANTVFVGGDFTTVNGVARKQLALVNVTTGQPVPTWQPPVLNFGGVTDLKTVGDTLYVSGTFTKLNNIAHGGLASVVAVTGQLDPKVSVNFTEHHNNTGTGAQGRVGVDQIDITPDGTTLIAIGNFRRADGLLRDQVALLDVASSVATVNPSWATDWYTDYCNNFAVDSYVRGVSFSPDGSYFVISAKGGFHPGTGCDAALRYETANLSLDAQPTWRIETGGDTLWGIAITDNAVYVGGHQKWLNNPKARVVAGPGAVPRPGLVALDPISGRPLAWNPGRDPRGVAVFVIYPLETGIYIGSNTAWIGTHDYYRPRVAFFPYTGDTLAATTTQQLPGTMYVAAPRSNGSDPHLYATTLDATGRPVSPKTVTTFPFDLQSRAAFLVGNRLFTGHATDLTMYQQFFDGTVLGPRQVVSPYHEAEWVNVPNGSGGTFDGVDPTLYSQYATVGSAAYTGGRMLYTRSNSKKLFSKLFSPDSGIMDERYDIVPTSVSFTGTTGMFVVGNKLFYVTKSKGALYSVSWTGSAVVGPATQVGGPGIDGVDYTGSTLFLGP